MQQLMGILISWAVASTTSCGASTPLVAPQAVLELTVHQLYTATFPPPAVQRPWALTTSALSFAAYYQSLLANSNASTLTLEGFTLPSSRDTLESTAGLYHALAMRYPTVGDFWRAIHYDPLAAVGSEEEFSESLSSLLSQVASYRKELGLEESKPSPCPSGTPSHYVFYSGRTDGISSRRVAQKMAAEMGGWTIYDFLDATGEPDPEGEGWTRASQRFAQCAKGPVLAVIGNDLRMVNFWEADELPALRSNQAVTSIIAIDPATGETTVIQPSLPSTQKDELRH